MIFRNFTPRCPHGFAIGIVPCEECKTKVLYGASSHLRRAYDRARVGRKAPATYRGQGTTAMHGNGNRGWKY